MKYSMFPYGEQCPFVEMLEIVYLYVNAYCAYFKWSNYIEKITVKKVMKVHLYKLFV